MTCPACGTPVPGSPRFCGHCGAAQRTAQAPDGDPANDPAPDRLHRRWALAAVVVILAAALAVAATRDATTPVEPADGDVAVDPADARGRAPARSAGPALQPVRADRLDGRLVCDTARDGWSGPCPAWLLAEEGSDDVLLAATDGAFAIATPRSLTRVDAATGETRWRWPVPPGTRPTAVAASADLVVVALDDGRLHAFSSVIGSERWSTDRGAAPATALTVTPTYVAVTEPRRLALRGSSNGALLWASGRPATGVPSSVHPDPGGGSGVAIVADGALQVLDAASGERHWRAEVDGTVAPVATTGLVISVSPDRRLQAHRRGTGELAWDVDDVAGAHQLVPTGDVIAVATPGGLHAYEAATGDRVTTVHAGGTLREVRAGPARTVYRTTPRSLELIDVGTAGPTWTARVGPTLQFGDAIAGTPDGAHVAIAIDGPRGTTIAGFEPVASLEPQPGPCPGSLVSTALGGVIGWRGDHAHVRPDRAVYGTEVGQILLGIPGWPADGSGGDITVSATLEGADTDAAFGRFDGDLRAEHVITGGARSSSGWPTHWAFAGHLPAAGCWSVTVATDRWEDTIVVPISVRTVTP